MPTGQLYDDYIDFAKKIGVRFQLIPSDFGKEIKKLCPQVEKKRPKADHPSCGNGRKWHYFFPALEECRKAFEQLVNIELQWS